MDPLISVIVPVYNVEKYLSRCVESIRMQTYKNLEIILVDDGSPDRCPELCDQIKVQDSRIKVIHKENGGLGFARNSGMDIAMGTYVLFIDSDDWISEDHIENLYREAERTASDAVIGSHTRVTALGDVFPRSIHLEQKIYEGPEIREDIVLPLIGSNINFPKDAQLEASSCMNLYSMDVISSGNIRFPSEKIAISEDLFFNVDFFCNAKRVSVLNETGYFYVENLSSISRKYDRGRLDRTICFYNAMKSKVAQYGLDDSFSYRVERTFLMNIRFAVRMIIWSEMTQKEKYQEINRILMHKQVKDVLDSYPIDTYVPSMRLLTRLMQAGKVKFVYWLMSFRECIRR